ncbi:hypothetical protein MKZ38_006085 [Zalerion maritima]|uniref:Uncharacterized protein n=1 Tax=Zalerion maritima TaxID=339359 RepID=A0AAD5S3M5_9PEZI|nr:hypothetical protein MKZ38_006085 [Zalerion maritima]
MKVYTLILLAIATISAAAETEGEQLTTLATVEVEAPTPTAIVASETAATTDAPDATDTVEPESSEFTEDDTAEAENDVGSAVNGEEAGLNVTSEAELPPEFRGQAGNEALLDQEDPLPGAEPEGSGSNSTSLERRRKGGPGGGNHPVIPYCFGPFNVWNLRFGMTCPYYSRLHRFHGHRGGHRRHGGVKLHVDLRVWQRGGWRAHRWWKKLANLQVAQYTHRGRQCGFVRDKVTRHTLFDACRWWPWGGSAGMAFKLTRVAVKHFRIILHNAGWPHWMASGVIGGTIWPVYHCILKLRFWVL